MIIIYIALIVFGIIFIYTATLYITLFFKFIRFYKYMSNLDCDFKLYNARKKILESKNYSYDTIFPFDYSTDGVSIKANLSQKELIAILYDGIEKLDKLIPKLPDVAFKDDIEKFYELRRLIRTEKLINENTTF